MMTSSRLVPRQILHAEPGSHGMSPFFDPEPTLGTLNNIVRAYHHLVSNTMSRGIAHLFCHSAFCNISWLLDVRPPTGLGA